MIRAKHILFLSVTGLFALTACTDPSVQTSDPNLRAKEGALVGGLLGAVAGAATGGDSGERARGALIGGAVGAGVGAAVGSSLDKQAADLRRSLDRRVSIVNEGDRLIVRLPNDILFAVDSATVSPGLQSDLRVLARSLQTYPGTRVLVIGHADNTGAASYNQDLSTRRASAVSSVLISNGVSRSRIRASGRGETQPIATNLTPEGRALNRRVEIVILANR